MKNKEQSNESVKVEKIKKKPSKKRIIITSIIAGLLILSILGHFVAGCIIKDKKKKECVDIWFDTATAKIFRQENVEDKSLKTLSISMAKNEYEGGQLLMYAKEDVNEYRVEVSDLVCGNNIIEKENVSIYNVKYINSDGVATKYLNDSLPQDSEMPDAILPFKTAEEFGENRITKGNNQAVYIEVYTPKTVPSGLYKGKIKLYVDGYDYYMTISVNVHDYVLPDEPSMMNYMALWDSSQFAAAELSSAPEMEVAYFEALLKYRMSSMLPFNGEGGIPRYIELLRKYYTSEGFSCYKFFYEPTHSVYNGEIIAVNLPLLKDYLKAVAKASIEDRVDYLKKAIFYFSTSIDEPSESSWPLVRLFSTTIAAFLKDVAVELDTELVSETNYDFYVSNVRESLVSIPNTLPCAASIEKLELEDCADITAINGLQLFNTQADRDKYLAEGRETWFYTCIGPQYPYPNLLANNYLTSVREISWMQRCYGIDGFLVWSTANYTTSDNGGKPVVDNYTSLGDTMTGVSDGKIFYPGYPYDIFGPVASLRAVAYRDGVEDYEILNEIYNKYKEVGLDATSVMQEYYDYLFSGVIPNFDADFYGIRENTISTLEDLNSDFAIYYKDITYSNDIATIKFVLKNSNATVKFKNQVLQKNANNEYVVQLNSATDNYFSVEITVSGKTKTYNKYIFGKYSLVEDFEDGEQDVIGVNGIGEKSVVGTNSISGDKSIEVTLNGLADSQEDFYPWFSINTNSLGDFSKITSLCFDIYVEQDINFEVFTKNTVNEVSYETSLMTLNLKSGINQIEMVLPSSVRTMEGLQSLRFRTNNILNADNSAGSIKLYLDNIACRIDAKKVEEVVIDKGTIEVQESEYQGRDESKIKPNKLIANDVSNVIEDGYLLLADFENYNQIAQLRFNNGFGKLEMVTDDKYVTHGNQALKCTIYGNGERIGHYDPQMFIYTSLDYFQLNNLSTVDYVEVDLYNAMDYDLVVRFSLTWIYFAKGYEYESITLKPGMNHVVISLEKLKKCYGNEIPYFTFIFDRGELHEENQVVYIDNFKAHLIKEENN